MKIKDCKKIIKILEISKSKYEDKLWCVDIDLMVLRLESEINRQEVSWKTSSKNRLLRKR